MSFENPEEARKNRERIAELQRKEAEKPEPSQSKQPLHKLAIVEASGVEPNKTEPTPLEDYELGVNREVTEPHKPTGAGTPSMQLNFALGLLREDNIKAFTQDYEQRVSEYGKDSSFDAYMEALIERNDLVSISKMLQHWIKYLETLPNCQHTRGAIMMLHTLDGLCLSIEGMRPNED